MLIDYIDPELPLSHRKQQPPSMMVFAWDRKLGELPTKLPGGVPDGLRPVHVFAQDTLPVGTEILSHTLQAWYGAVVIES